MLFWLARARYTPRAMEAHQKPSAPAPKPARFGGGRWLLLTHEPFWPPSGGGSAEAFYLAKELLRRGSRVEVMAPEGERSASPPETPGLRVRPFRGWRLGRYSRFRPLRYLFYPLKLVREARALFDRNPPDAILAQHALSCAAAGRLKRAWGAPAVFNYLDCLAGYLERWPLMPRPAARALVRYELALPRRLEADAALAVSDELAERLAQNGFPASRILPIYYGFDAELFRFDPNSPRSPEPLAVMHGSFDRHHIGPIAMEAARRLLRSHPRLRIRFVGRVTGPLRKLLRRLEKDGLGRRVEATGFAPYAEVAEKIRPAWAGLVPYEDSTGAQCAFVAKAVEYLAVGVPTICTNLAGLRRFFGKEPMIRFAAFDPAAFAEAVLAELETPPETRAEAARKASARVAKELDWRTICRRAIDFAEAAAARAKTKSEEGR